MLSSLQWSVTQLWEIRWTFLYFTRICTCMAHVSHTHTIYIYIYMYIYPQTYISESPGKRELQLKDCLCQWRHVYVCGTLSFWLFLFLHYNYNIYPFPLLPLNSPTHPSPFSLKFVAPILSVFFACIYEFVYTYIFQNITNLIYIMLLACMFSGQNIW